MDAAREADVHIGLGSNLGDRAAYLRSAIASLGELPETRLIAVSSIYETPPAGGPPGQGNYYNCACHIRTRLSPRRLLDAGQLLEREAGRDRAPGAERWGPRTLDVDILLWDDLVLALPDLTIPHPRLALRAFVLAPLAEISPGLTHPVEKKTVRELLERIGADEGIRRLSL